MNNEKEIVLTPCESGRYLAWYKHREDIISNGDNKDECLENLKKLYAMVMEHEEKK